MRPSANQGRRSNSQQSQEEDKEGMQSMPVPADKNVLPRCSPPSSACKRRRHRDRRGDWQLARPSGANVVVACRRLLALPQCPGSCQHMTPQQALRQPLRLRCRKQAGEHHTPPAYLQTHALLPPCRRVGAPVEHQPAERGTIMAAAASPSQPGSQQACAVMHKAP